MARNLIRKIYTANGTFTAPGGVTQVKVIAANSSEVPLNEIVAPVVPGTAYTVSITGVNYMSLGGFSVYLQSGTDELIVEYHA